MDFQRRQYDTQIPKTATGDGWVKEECLKATKGRCNGENEDRGARGKGKGRN